MSALQEKPIEHSKNQIIFDDTLEVIDYAKALVNFIETCSPPLTIGIQGDWGSGKTSLLNMIRGSAEGDEGGLLGSKRSKDGGYLVVNFDAWAYAQFGQEENLPLSCMYSLTKKIEDVCNQEIQKTASDVIKNTATKLLDKVSNVSKFKAAGIELQIKENPEFDELAQSMLKFKKEFKGYVDSLVTGPNKKYKRIVIFIDDLDRVNPRYAIELLESLKNFMDVDNCIFVIAIDYSVVQTGVALKFGEAIQKRSGRSFFDKIIQLPFVMPSSSYNLNRYIISLISEAGLPYISIDKNSKDYIENIKKIQNEDWVTKLKDLTICSVGTNPRQIKRVVNIVKLINIIRSEKSTIETKSDKMESMILYGLVCMQVAWPDIFSIFSKNPSYAVFARLEDWEYLDSTLPEIYPDSTDSEIEIIKNQLSAFIDTFMSLIDKDNDESVSAQEFERVQLAMQKAKLTSVTSFRSPKDEFIQKINSDLEGLQGKFRQDLLDYFNSLIKSKWLTSHSLKYNNNATRYMSIAMGRRQIGSLVTLKTRPLLLRLKGTMDNANKILGDKYPGFILTEQAHDSSLTGYGELLIDFSVISKNQDKINQSQMLEALNLLYDNLT